MDEILRRCSPQNDREKQQGRIPDPPLLEAATRS